MPAKKAKKAVKKAVKKVAKKVVAKKKVVKAVKKVAAPAKKKLATVKAAFSKSQVMSHIAEATGIKKKEVVAVIEELTNVINAHVKKGAVGEFTLPGLAKLRVVNKPATKARKGINPFTGEEVMFKAKPARNIIKIRALKKLKDMAK